MELCDGQLKLYSNVNGTALNELNSTVWLLLGTSVFALAAAIVFAIYYRKH